MSLTHTAVTYEPSVRGDAMLLTHGRKGTAEDLLLVAGALVIDGALGGHIDVVAGGCSASSAGGWWRAPSCRRRRR